MSREPCYKCKFEEKPIDTQPCEYCSSVYMETGDHPNYESAKPQTHYDSIKSMSIDRLALFLADMCDGSDKEYWLAWLQQEVDDADTR